jgi:hypothetical protein
MALKGAGIAAIFASTAVSPSAAFFAAAFVAAVAFAALLSVFFSATETPYGGEPPEHVPRCVLQTIGHCLFLLLFAGVD